MKNFSRTLIHAIPTNNDEELQFAITQYEDRYYVDVRLWFRSPEAKGLRPSRKGISLPMHRLLGLKEGVAVLSEASQKLPELKKATNASTAVSKAYSGGRKAPD